MSDHEAAIDAALCVAASLHRQRRTKTGQFIDISEVEVQINRIDAVLGRMLAGEAEPSNERTAYDMGGPATCFECSDGYVYLFMTTKAHWQALSALMGDPAWVERVRAGLAGISLHAGTRRAVPRPFPPVDCQQEKLPITEAAQKAGVAMVPINTAADLPRHEQFIHRGFFQQLDGLPIRPCPTG